MIVGTVRGQVWSTRRIDGMPGGALLDVEVENSGAHLVAFDTLGTGVGERVLITQGSVAAGWFSGPPPPIDALIIGAIDDVAG